MCVCVYLAQAMPTAAMHIIIFNEWIVASMRMHLYTRNFVLDKMHEHIDVCIELSLFFLSSYFVHLLGGLHKTIPEFRLDACTTADALVC